ncbi:MAG: hypothetical protein KF773_00475 [Deltaproteobacteria bacterium]|nr:hypothetical protein [Deltaproteobacteria bacterium]
MSRKRIPSTSKLTRAQTMAYARKQKSGGGDEKDAKDDDQDAAEASAGDKTEKAGAPADAKVGEKEEAKVGEKAGEKPDVKAGEKPDVKAGEKPDVKAGEKPDVKIDAKTDSVDVAADDAQLDKASAEKKQKTPKGVVAAVEPPPPSVTPAEVAAKSVDASELELNLRSRTATLTMPAAAPTGEPPQMPRAASSAAVAVEDPTFMPGPKDVPTGSPNDPAAPPGRVPRGDSRSLRRWDDREFALVYRVQTFVITRFGAVGTRGQWRVVEYPTSASASHAYAKECSHFVTEGFSDYRD